MNNTFIHLVLNHLNSLGLIQELHVGKDLNFKVHESKLFYSKVCVCVNLFFSSQILMLAKKKRKKISVLEIFMYKKKNPVWD